MFFSIIIPTYNRQNDVNELLISLVNQEYKDFEVIICDNSPDDSLKTLIQSFQHEIRLSYSHNKDLRASGSRNAGAERAKGDFLIFIDSDCIVPPQYLKTVDSYLETNDIDAYGGPDSVHESFTTIQKAINYSMTSFLTTGGIRGGSNPSGNFQPRSFNMGVKREVFIRTGGFRSILVAEDIDLSIRLYNNHCKIVLIKDAFVYHKRRTSFEGFFRQVFAFGKGRYHLKKTHQGALKLIHLMPALFVLYLVFGLLAFFVGTSTFIIWLGSIMAYFTLIFLDSITKTKSLVIGLLSIYASLLMLFGYGSGMIVAFLHEKLNMKA